jgi:hypothetical protein
MQSWIAPVISLALWGALLGGALTRGWYFASIFGLSTIYGLRTFVAIASQRLSTIKRVAAMMNAANGSRDAEHRRRMILSAKMTSLAIDFLVVFLVAVATPASFLLLKSVFDSQRFAVHSFVATIATLPALNLSIGHLHYKVSKSRSAAMGTPTGGGGGGQHIRKDSKRWTPKGMSLAASASVVPASEL